MKKFFVLLLLSLITCNLYAGGFDDAINNVRQNCSGFSESLSDLKKMAGINTAITGVGTLAATGATVVGIIKSNTDSDLEKILAKVNTGSSSTNPSAYEVTKTYNEYIETYGTIENVKTELETKSKTLGNWRTGLVGGATATNIVGAVIAGNNKLDDDFQTQIDNCIKSVDLLKNAIGQARMDGIDTTRANNIVKECDDLKNIDLSVINKRATGAMVSSIIGAATGVAGTVTSAVANTDKTRNSDDKTEKNLNTAANVLSGGTVVASGVATVFNATQISTIKKIVNIAEKCEKVLQ